MAWKIMFFLWGLETKFLYRRNLELESMLTCVMASSGLLAELLKSAGMSSFWQGMASIIWSRAGAR